MQDHLSIPRCTEDIGATSGASSVVPLHSGKEKSQTPDRMRSIPTNCSSGGASSATMGGGGSMNATSRGATPVGGAWALSRKVVQNVINM